MIDVSKIDYSPFDHPIITERLFHPRVEWPHVASKRSVESILIPVEKDIVVGGRLHIAGESAANLLFFHGNGEIAADYNDLGYLYTEMGINFLPVDYRGYGESTGKPTVTAMMRDCHIIFHFIKNLLGARRYRGPFLVMGRSLGSASALELASCYKDHVDGLIVESGFAYASPLFSLLGIDMEFFGIKEENGFRNIDKIRIFDKPTVIIHAEYDQIISFWEGQLLFDTCPAKDKRLFKVPEANHNDIIVRGMPSYMELIKWLSNKASTSKCK
jgi:uncharacterized protein